MSDTKDKCPTCGQNKWNHIPDSLADACECGYVRVFSLSDEKHKQGASVQEWLHDVYGIPLPKKDK